MNPAAKIGHCGEIPYKTVGAPNVGRVVRADQTREPARFRLRRERIGITVSTASPYRRRPRTRGCLATSGRAGAGRGVIRRGGEVPAYRCRPCPSGNAGARRRNFDNVAGAPSNRVSGSTMNTATPPEPNCLVTRQPPAVAASASGSSRRGRLADVGAHSHEPHPFRSGSATRTARREGCDVNGLDRRRTSPILKPRSAVFSVASAFRGYVHLRGGGWRPQGSAAGHTFGGGGRPPPPGRIPLYSSSSPKKESPTSSRTSPRTIPPTTPAAAPAITPPMPPPP